MKLKSLILIATIVTWIMALDLSYAQYDAFLKQTVCDGGVWYTKVVESTVIDEIGKRLSAVTKAEYDKLTENDQIAFLINSYNVFTLILIKNNYPLTTGIRDIRKPWDKKFIDLLEKKVSLNDIEHEMLRKDFNEPRIHFAIVCASKSCPALLNEAFTGKKLDQQLDLAAKIFLTDTTKNRVEGRKLRLSKIFDWYGGDFKKKYGGYKEYVTSVLGLEGKHHVSFLEYDWSLNEVKSCK